MASEQSLPTEENEARRERGRDAYARRQWQDAYTAFSGVDSAEPLAIEDLEGLAWSALFTCRDDAFFVAAERVHQAYAASDATARAARWAFWICFRAFAM